MLMRRLAYLFSMLTLLTLSLSAELPDLPALPDLPSFDSEEASSADDSLFDLDDKPDSMPPLGGPSGLPDKKDSLGPPKVSPSKSSSSGPDTELSRIANARTRGNWAKKRMWLLKAREQQDLILNLLEEIQEYASGVYDKNLAQIDDELDDFYRTLGAQRGKAEEWVSSLQKYLTDAENVVNGDKEKRALAFDAYTDLFEARAELNKLKAEMEHLTRLDHSLAQRMNRFNEYMSEAFAKQAEVETNIEQMLAMVDHEKAREWYYKIEGHHGHVQAIATFLKNDLTKDFDALVKMIRKKIKHAKSLYEKFEKIHHAMLEQKSSDSDDESSTDTVDEESADDKSGRNLEKSAHGFLHIALQVLVEFKNLFLGL